MGLFDVLSQWRNTWHENHVNHMKEQNKCPDCFGRGFFPLSANEFMFYSSLHECPGCHGSGLYTDWNHRAN